MPFSCEKVGFRQVRGGSKNICINRDWYKVSEIWCESDMTDIECLVESYRNAKEIRKNLESEKAVSRIRDGSTVVEFARTVSKVFRCFWDTVFCS